MFSPADKLQLAFFHPQPSVQAQEKVSTLDRFIVPEKQMPQWGTRNPEMLLATREATGTSHRQIRNLVHPVQSIHEIPLDSWLASESITSQNTPPTASTLNRPPPTHLPRPNALCQ
jgi:hypothetical protein